MINEIDIVRIVPVEIKYMNESDCKTKYSTRITQDNDELKLRYVI